jgi:hypothetical protein
MKKIVIFLYILALIYAHLYVRAIGAGCPLPPIARATDPIENLIKNSDLFHYKCVTVSGAVSESCITLPLLVGLHVCRVEDKHNNHIYIICSGATPKQGRTIRKTGVFKQLYRGNLGLLVVIVETTESLEK